LIVDLLFASSGVEPEIAARAEALALLEDLVVPVARTGDLLALKLLARDDASRPQDAVDLSALREGRDR
jgi:predicted nucleotidyltransferase